MNHLSFKRQRVQQKKGEINHESNEKSKITMGSSI